MSEYNINLDVTIYPSEKGWEMIPGLLSKKYMMHADIAKAWTDKRRTADGGYRDHLWSIISDLSELFYMGTDKLASMKIELNED